MYICELEIFKNIYRLTLAPKTNFEFSQFLILDEKTCLIHAGKQSLFNVLKNLVIDKLKGRELDYILFSHVEADETGAINNWLEIYPNAKVVCNKIANINLEDFILRPAQIFNESQELNLGNRNLKLINTPHFPHNWDAHMWFETTESILFSSDFCCQAGQCEPMVNINIGSSIIDFYTKGGFIPYGKSTNEMISKLMKLPIQAIAPMHGSVINGVICKSILKEVQDDLLLKSQIDQTTSIN